MAVTIRERKGKKGIHLYMDIYQHGKRKTQSLKLVLIENPKTKQDKLYNKQVREKAQRIKDETVMDIHKFGYDRTVRFNSDHNFFEYAYEILETKKGKTKETWIAALKHFCQYNKHSEILTFAQMDIPFMEGFKQYLLKTVAQNSGYSYFNRIRAVLNQAEKEYIIHFNPNNYVTPIAQADSQREYLTFEELQLLSKTECKSKKLKRAFLFSCYTGLRWSDIHTLKWEDISNNVLRFRPKKTQQKFLYLKLNETALNILGEFETEHTSARIFPLSYNNGTNLTLQDWAYKAGIYKRITFHCGRHTFATMAITYGADIYVLKEVLGHSDIKTTAIYAKIIDKRKDEVMDCIPSLDI